MSADITEHVFLRRSSGAGGAAWWIVGGITLLASAAGGLVLAIVASLDTLALHAITTLPTMLGLGALAAGWAFARAPQQVSIGAEALTVVEKNQTREIPWDRIGWATVTTGMMNMNRMLVVYDTSGKTLVSLSNVFDDFDQLVELVQHKIARQANPVSDTIQVKKAHKSALLALITGAVLFSVAIGLTAITYHDQRMAWRLTENGKPGHGRIVRRFLAPNGVTTRLEYEVSGNQGKTAVRNAEVTRAYWDSLAGKSEVRVVYVADEPSISRLVEGEPVESDFFKTPLGGYGLAAAGAVLSWLMIGAGVMQWFGWDLDFDSKSGRISVTRFGMGK